MRSKTRPGHILIALVACGWDALPRSRDGRGRCGGRGRLHGGLDMLGHYGGLLDRGRRKGARCCHYWDVLRV